MKWREMNGIYFCSTMAGTYYIWLKDMWKATLLRNGVEVYDRPKVFESLGEAMNDCVADLIYVRLKEKKK